MFRRPAISFAFWDADFTTLWFPISWRISSKQKSPSHLEFGLFFQLIFLFIQQPTFSHHFFQAVFPPFTISSLFISV